MFLFCTSRLRHQYSRNSTSVRYPHQSLDDVMSSTREDVISRTHVLLRCADSSLNHEWSKTASFVSCLDACLDAIGVRTWVWITNEARLRLLSHVLMLVLTQSVCGLESESRMKQDCVFCLMSCCLSWRSWCADSSLNHEWSKTASFVSCLDVCLDAVGVRPP
jgi:hypothetical protein